MKKTAFATFNEAKEMMYEIMDAARNFQPWPMRPEGDFHESAIGGVWLLDFWLRGDWKHDHWAFNSQVQELYPFLLYKGESVTESNGSDYYTAVHQFAFAGKDVDLNAMARLFANKQGGKAMKKRAKGDFREECVEELHDGQYTVHINEFWYDGFPFPLYQYDIECPDGTWVYADDEYESIQDCEDGARVEIAEIENETMMRMMLGSKKVVGYDYDDWLYDNGFYIGYEPDDDYYNYSARLLDDSVMPQTVSDFGTLVSGSVIYYEFDANVCYSCSYNSYHTRYDNLCKPNYRRQYYAYVWGIYEDPDGYPFAICQQTLDGATSPSPAPTYVDVSNDYYSDYDGFDGNSPQEWIRELVEYLQDTNRGFTHEVLNSLPDEGEMVREWYEGYEDYKADNYDPYDDDRW